MDKSKTSKLTYFSQWLGTISLILFIDTLYPMIERVEYSYYAAGLFLLLFLVAYGIYKISTFGEK